jgi:polysaccharide export outer membrane protein
MVRCVLGLIGGWLCLTACGCAGHTMYQAAKLPAEFQAPILENPRTVDLSRLASFAVSNELIDRGDVLELTIVTGYGKLESSTTPIRVGDDGMASIPLVGKVELAGLELEEAEQAIAGAGVHRGVFRDPHVTVTMNRQRVNKVTVIGAVEKPGVYDLPRGSSALLGALVAAGGLSEDAGTDVEIRRPHRGMPGMLRPHEPRDKLAQVNYLQAHPATVEPPSIRVNLVSAAREGRGGYYLEDGDVVMVEKRDPKPVHVLGLVKKPGEYELPVNRDLRVLDALALAGGLDVPWANKVAVIRQVPGQADPIVINLTVTEAKRNGQANLRLGAGDVVSVEQTPVTVMYEAIKVINFGVGTSLPLF